MLPTNLATIFENKLLEMDHITFTCAEHPPTPQQGSPALALCPSKPFRRVPQFTIEGDDLVVPLDVDDASKVLMVPLADFPPMPFGNVDTPDAIPQARSDGKNSREFIAATKTSTPMKKLPQAKRGSLAHLDRRRRSFGAKCA